MIKAVPINFTTTSFKSYSKILKSACGYRRAEGLYQFNLVDSGLDCFSEFKKNSNNDVSYISESNDGKLWIGWYFGGIGLFDPELHAYDTTQIFDLKSTATISVFEDSYGYLWGGSQNAGLDVFRKRPGRSVEKVSEYSIASFLPSQYVKCFLEDHLGNVWIGTTKGLVLFIRPEGKFIVMNNLLPPQRGVFSLLEDKNKRLWIGTQGNGIYTIDLQGFDGRRTSLLALASCGNARWI